MDGRKGMTEKAEGLKGAGVHFSTLQAFDGFQFFILKEVSQPQARVTHWPTHVAQLGYVSSPSLSKRLRTMFISMKEVRCSLRCEPR